MGINCFRRKDIRLKGYNYSNRGCYFITICTDDRKHFFGKIVEKEMCLSEIGIIAKKKLQKIPEIYDCVTIDKFEVMPNHIHFILMIKQENKIDVSRIIKQYKQAVTKIIGRKIWQRSYFERVIRTEEEYYQVRNYIATNVENWLEDKYYE